MVRLRNDTIARSVGGILSPRSLLSFFHYNPFVRAGRRAAGAGGATPDTRLVPTFVHYYFLRKMYNVRGKKREPRPHDHERGMTPGVERPSINTSIHKDENPWRNHEATSGRRRR